MLNLSQTLPGCPYSILKKSSLQITLADHFSTGMLDCFTQNIKYMGFFTVCIYYIQMHCIWVNLKLLTQTED